MHIPEPVDLLCTVQHVVMLICCIDALGILDMAGVSCHPASALHAATDRRSRDDHDALPLRSWRIPSTLHPELDLPVLRRRVRGADRGVGGYCADGAVFGLLLHLLDEVCTRLEISLVGDADSFVQGITREEIQPAGVGAHDIWVWTVCGQLPALRSPPSPSQGDWRLLRPFALASIKVLSK